MSDTLLAFNFDALQFNQRVKHLYTRVMHTKQLEHISKYKKIMQLCNFKVIELCVVATQFITSK